MPAFRIAVGLASTIVFACALLPAHAALAASRAAEPEIPDAWPKWLKKDMQRESRKKKSRPVKMGDGMIETRIIGKVISRPEAIEDGWFFTADIGGDGSLMCWFHVEPRNLANQIEGLHQIVMDETVAANEAEFKGKSPYFVDSGVFDRSPYLVSEWLFRIERDGEQQLGFSKARIAQKDGATFACAHSGLGYRKTFARIFEAMVDEAVVDLELAEPYYREIVTLSLGDEPAGVAVAEFTLDEDGDTRLDLVTSMLLRVDANSIVASDNRKIEFSTPYGMLINAYDAVVLNGELGSDLTLNYQDESWVVAGLFGGKDIAVTIDGSEDPMSSLGQMLAVRAALRADDGQVNFRTWIPDADPSQFLDASVAIGERGDPLSSARLALGPLAMDATVDDQGSLVDVSVPLGASTLSMKRVFVSGRVPDFPAE